MAITINGNGTITGITSGAGKILQVVQTVKTDTTSTSSTSWSDLSGLSVSITPSSTSSKILVRYDVTAGTFGGAYSGGIRVLRDTTTIYLGDAAGSRIRSSSWCWSGDYNYQMWLLGNEFLDSPATTSALTYKLQFMSGYSGYSFYINRNYNDGDNANHARVPSQITVMEVQG